MDTQLSCAAISRLELLSLLQGLMLCVKHHLDEKFSGLKLVIYLDSMCSSAVHGALCLLLFCRGLNTIFKSDVDT